MSSKRKTSRVELPNGEIVAVIQTIDDSCFEHDMTGYCDPKLLAPYKNQPRQFADPDNRERLLESVKNTGVRDKIIVTPMSKAPWAVTEPGDENLPYLIVSGNTRRDVATDPRVGLVAVPFEVRVYASKESFDTDARVLNGPRSNLTEIEEGFDFVNKLKEGKRVADIARETGYTRPVVDGRIALTKLAPEIMKLISPKLTRRQRLAFGLAAALGGVKLPEESELILTLEELGDIKSNVSSMDDEEQRFTLQRAYLAYCKKQGWKGQVSRSFILTGKRPEKSSSGASSRNGTAGHHNDNPRIEKKGTMRDQMIDWVVVLNQTEFLDKPPVELERIFGYAIKEDLDAMASLVEMAAEQLRNLAAKKRDTSSTILEMNGRKEQKALPLVQ